MPKNQPGSQDEEISPLVLIEKAVNLALQADQKWTPEISETIGEIVHVAETLTQEAKTSIPGIFTHRKVSAVETWDALFRAIAIYKQVVADLSGMTIEQVEEKVKSYKIKRA